MYMYDGVPLGYSIFNNITFYANITQYDEADQYIGARIGRNEREAEWLQLHGIRSQFQLFFTFSF